MAEARRAKLEAPRTELETACSPAQNSAPEQAACRSADKRRTHQEFPLRTHHIVVFHGPQSLSAPDVVASFPQVVPPAEVLELLDAIALVAHGLGPLPALNCQDAPAVGHLPDQPPCQPRHQLVGFHTADKSACWERLTLRISRMLCLA